MGSGATTLASALTGAGWLGTTSAGDLAAYATVPVPASPPASLPFVTVSFVPAQADVVAVAVGTTAHLELWFHPQPPSTGVVLESVAISQPSVTIFDDASGAQLFPVPGGVQAPTVAQRNIWTILSSILANEKPPAYLRLVFSTTATQVQVTRRLRVPVGPGPVTSPLQPAVGTIIGDPFTETISLAQWITETGIRYVGWDGDLIVAYARVAGSAAQGAVDG